LGSPLCAGKSIAPATAIALPKLATNEQGGSVKQLVSKATATHIFGSAPYDNELDDLNRCLNRFEINTPNRIRHFMAQIAHESGGLRYLEEIADGSDYEGRSDLGNTRQGDGRRFKGGGVGQVTGRSNYQRFSDFIGDPKIMEGVTYLAKVYPFTSFGWWWSDNKINSYLDSGASCRQVSARVNGTDPANGLSDREQYYRKACDVI
jgi:predicted chitinase